MTDRIERTARVAAPAAVALFAVLAAALSERPAPLAVTVAVLVSLLATAMAAAALRGWPLLGGCLLALAGLTVLAGGQAANVGWFGACVLAGWCAFAAAPVVAGTYCAVAGVGFVVQLVAVSSDSGWGAWIAGTLFTTVACALARRQGVLLEQLREAQSGLADRARSEERTRIAREMHDVIGHALTVTLLHISSARLAVDDEPDAARASLEEAERQARRSLEEVRASVGLLREGPEDALPLPGGADLDELVAAYRRTGAPVSCEVVGDATGLPATTGLAAYRIVQEALTNAARHAPGSATAVRVEVGARDTTVVVDSAGLPDGRAVEGTGVTGMRERAEAVGGRLTAGPAGHGWRVEAVLPS